MPNPISRGGCTSFGVSNSITTKSLPVVSRKILILLKAKKEGNSELKKVIEKLSV